MAAFRIVAGARASCTQVPPDRRSSPNLSEDSDHCEKFINDPADVVSDALRGMAVAYPELRVDQKKLEPHSAGDPDDQEGRVSLNSGDAADLGVLALNAESAAAVRELLAAPRSRY